MDKITIDLVFGAVSAILILAGVVALLIGETNINHKSKKNAKSK
jgi:hypothetical protein